MSQLVTTTATLDSTKFRQGMKALSQYKNIGPDEVNQRGLNVAGRAFRNLPPKNWVAKRKEVKSYMDTVISQRVKISTRGKTKGKFVKAGRARDQLTLKILIAQARRRKLGLKGLTGKAIARAAGRLSQRSQVAQGYVKSFLIPIIRALNPVCRFKVPAAVTGSNKSAKGSMIAQWGPQYGTGTVQKALPGWSPTCTSKVEMNVAADQAAKVNGIQVPIYQQALEDEGKEMLDHAAKQLAKLVQI